MECGELEQRDNAAISDRSGGGVAGTTTLSSSHFACVSRPAEEEKIPVTSPWLS